MMQQKEPLELHCNCFKKLCRKVKGGLEEGGGGGGGGGWNFQLQYSKNNCNLTCVLVLSIYC